jgi:hypothetical protein
MVKDAQDFLKSLLGAETGALLILFGMALILLAVIGAIQGKIDLGRRARIAGGALGVMCLAWGVWLQSHKQTADTVTPKPVEPNTAGPISPQPAPGSPDKPKIPVKSKSCHVEPKPWRWTTTGRLILDLDDKGIGIIDVGKGQSGFDFPCVAGDHTYRVHSESMAVACSGPLKFPNDSVRLDLVFTQTAPGPPDCKLEAAP